MGVLFSGVLSITQHSAQLYYIMSPVINPPPSSPALSHARHSSLSELVINPPAKATTPVANMNIDAVIPLMEHHDTLIGVEFKNPELARAARPAHPGLLIEVGKKRGLMITAVVPKPSEVKAGGILSND